MGMANCRGRCLTGEFMIFPLGSWKKKGLRACSGCECAFEPKYNRCPCCSRLLRSSPYIPNDSIWFKRRDAKRI